MKPKLPALPGSPSNIEPVHYDGEPSKPGTWHDPERDVVTLGLIPAAFVGMLTGLAFALPIAAWTATRTTDSSFPAILRFAIIPMFLFGGAFYPIEQLPVWLQPVAWFTPLWHGIEWCRGLVLGGLTAWPAVGHLVVLLAFFAAGLLAARSTFDRRLRS